MPQNRSTLDRVRDAIAGPLPPEPPRPAAPAMPPEVYDAMKIDELTVRDVANIIANENRDVTPVPGRTTEENLQNARIAQAHAVINADRMYGFGRLDVVHTAPTTVTVGLERSPQYQCALEAARTAFRQQESGINPIGNRMYFHNEFDERAKLRRLGSETVGQYARFGPFSTWPNHGIYCHRREPRLLGASSEQEVVTFRPTQALALILVAAVPLAIAQSPTRVPSEGMVVDCPANQPGGSWVDDALQKDTVLRFNYLYEPPPASPGEYDYTNGIPNVYVAFWDRAKTKGTFLQFLWLNDESRPHLRIVNNAQIITTKEGVDLEDALWGVWTREHLIRRLRKLQAAPVRTVAVSTIGRTATLCDSYADPAN